MTERHDRAAIGRHEEAACKIALIRNHLGPGSALRLRGTDWFAWITAGASNTVLLTWETGVAEVLVTPDEAWILADEVDAQRLKDEELPDNFRVFISAWAIPEAKDEFVQNRAVRCALYSDRPATGERPLPLEIVQHKLILTPPEMSRYRQVGRSAAEAATEVMTAAQPDWTELELAAAGAQALWRRNLQPAQMLAAGSARLYSYRQPTPGRNTLGRVAMLAFSARGYGLHANLTRFVSFEPLEGSEQILHEQVRDIEAEALHCCIPGTRLSQVYDLFSENYTRRGHTAAIDQNHQGGLTGYQTREIMADPTSTHCLRKCETVAWNPSLAGARIEDTFLIHDSLDHDPQRHHGLENLTRDDQWPTVDVNGLARPLVWER